MPSRQQRTNNSRGQIPSTTIAATPEIVWTMLGANATQVVISTSVPVLTLVINGIPQFRILETNELPTGVTVTGPNLTITYAGPLPGGFNVSLPPRDPAIRTNTGGFMAPAIQRFAAPSRTTEEFLASGDIQAAQVGVYNGVAGLAAITLANGTREAQQAVVINPALPAATLTVTDAGGGTLATLAPNTIHEFNWTSGAWV